MSAAYPAQIKNFGADEIDEVDLIDAAHVNEVRAEIEAIETELGVDPAGAFSTVKAFLDNLNTTKYKAGDVLLGASGSVATPGIAFSGETTTGLSRPAAGAMVISTSGVERLRASSAGVSIATLAVTSLTVSGSTTGIDHGNLTGLADDDHTQYFNAARHDAHDHSVAAGSIVSADLADHNAATHNALALDHGSLAGTADNDHPQYLLSATHGSTSGAHVTNGNSHNHSGGDGAQVDHGALGGLSGDDHPQYGNVGVNETITGNWNFSNRVRSEGNYVVRSSVGGYISISSGGPSGGSDGDIWLEW